MTEGRRDFDAAAASWDENPGRVKVADDIAKAIRETVKPQPGWEALDFGCGTGLLTLRLRPSVHGITGVDTSRGMLDVLEAKVAQQKLANVKTLLADLEKGDTLDGQYDLVASSMTFHHVKEIGPVVATLAGVLKPGGVLAIADLDSDEGKFHESPEGVFHNGFDRCTIQKAFCSAGLTDVRNRTAVIIRKPAADGEIRAFSIFLMTGRKA